MLGSGASRWLEPELSATVRMPAASAAIRAATRAVRRDIVPPACGGGPDAWVCAGPPRAAHPCGGKCRRCERFSGDPDVAPARYEMTMTVATARMPDDRLDAALRRLRACGLRASAARR